MTQRSAADHAPPGKPTREPASTASQFPGSTAGRGRRELASWSWWQWQAKAAPYVFVSPFVLLFLAFMLVPLVSSIWLSLHVTSSPRAQVYVGAGNFAFLLGDHLFWTAVWNTLLYTVLFLTCQIPLALGLALLLNQPRLIGRNWFRLAFFSSHLVGSVFVAVIFAQLLAQRQGLVNRLIDATTPLGSEINWLGHPSLVMPAVVIAALWLSVGYAMIYFLAVLQAVDRDLYEAASVDGAGPLAKFWYITLPGIRPVLVFLVLVGTIGAFQLFELPYVLFSGPGPNNAGLTIVMYLFMQGFDAGNVGFASAVGWALVVLIMGVSMLQIYTTGLGRERD